MSFLWRFITQIAKDCFKWKGVMQSVMYHKKIVNSFFFSKHPESQNAWQLINLKHNKSNEFVFLLSCCFLSQYAASYLSSQINIQIIFTQCLLLRAVFVLYLLQAQIYVKKKNGSNGTRKYKYKHRSFLTNQNRYIAVQSTDSIIKVLLTHVYSISCWKL